MSEEKKTIELNEEELEKITGGVVGTENQLPEKFSSRDTVWVEYGKPVFCAICKKKMNVYISKDEHSGNIFRINHYFWFKCIGENKNQEHYIYSDELL